MSLSDTLIPPLTFCWTRSRMSSSRTPVRTSSSVYPCCLRARCQHVSIADFDGGAWPGRDAQNCCLNWLIRSVMSLSEGGFTPMCFASCKKRQEQRFSSCRSARIEYSIDQSERPSEIVVPDGNLALGGRVDRGRDVPAERAQLAGAELDGPDGGAAALEDEVVGPEPRELHLRLLDREQVLDRLRQRPVAVLSRRPQLAELVVALGEREATVQVDLERLGSDVVGGHVRVDPRVHAHRPRHRAPLTGQLGYRLAEELDVQLEPEGGDVPVLLGSEQVAGAADLEVAHRDREAGAELGVVGERRQPRAGLWGQLPRVRIEEVRVAEDVRAADPPADLVELGEPERVRPLDDERVC